MTSCDDTICPQSRRQGQERRRHRRRRDDLERIRWCARTMGPVVVAISLISISASVTISKIVTNLAIFEAEAKVDAIRSDVNQILDEHKEIMRLHLSP